MFQHPASIASDWDSAFTWNLNIYSSTAGLNMWVSGSTAPWQLTSFTQRNTGVFIRALLHVLTLSSVIRASVTAKSRTWSWMKRCYSSNQHQSLGVKFHFWLNIPAKYRMQLKEEEEEEEYTRRIYNQNIVIVYCQAAITLKISRLSKSKQVSCGMSKANCS